MLSLVVDAMSLTTHIPKSRHVILLCYIVFNFSGCKYIYTMKGGYSQNDPLYCDNLCLLSAI